MKGVAILEMQKKRRKLLSILGILFVLNGREGGKAIFCTPVEHLERGKKRTRPAARLESALLPTGREKTS